MMTLSDRDLVRIGRGKPRRQTGRAGKFQELFLGFFRSNR